MGKPIWNIKQKHQGFGDLFIKLMTKLDNQLQQKTKTEPTHSTDSHNHSGLMTIFPHWVQDRWEFILVALAGIFFVIGLIGQVTGSLPDSVNLIFFILAYIAGGYDIATHAIPALFKGKFNTDILMLAAAAGAALLNEWAEGAFLLFLFALGHAGEHYALGRAKRAISALGELMPQTALIKVGDEIVEKPIEAVEINDVVITRPGDRVPVDGEIVDGVSTLDQSVVTGESAPVRKGIGDSVFAGTINQTNSIEIKVQKLTKDNTLSRVMQLVEEAQKEQSPTQQLTERFTAWFVPTVLLMVVAVILVPPFFDWLTWEESFYKGMLLLVAASPCALAIGTPASILAGIAQAARNGVLIKGGVHLENLGRLDVIAFDKTGTLTEGAFKVTDVIPFGDNDDRTVLSIAAGAEQQSNHPLALSIVSEAKNRNLTLPSAEGIENIPGRGIRSEIDGETVLIGSVKLFAETWPSSVNGKIVDGVNTLEGAGKTTAVIGKGEEIVGIVALADSPRPGIEETLKTLLDLGIQKLVMLTGDNEDVALEVGQAIGLTDIKAELLPEQKLEAIQTLKKTHESIAMIGDGVNDAPALATATVGIAMGGAGTAVALETADIALMSDDLDKLPFVVGLSRATRAVIRQNLFISLGIIAILIVSSVVGVVALSGAVILHEGSTLIVVLNALRLMRFQPDSYSSS